MRMKSAVKGAALVFGLGASLATHAKPQHELVLGYMEVPGSIMQAAVDRLPERIRKATDGRVEIRTTSSLVGGNRLLEGVRDQIIDMTIPSNGNYSGTNPEFQLTILPTIADTSLEDALKVIHSSDYADALNTVLRERYNATAVMHGGWCRIVFFSPKPVTSLEDWKGLRIMSHNPGLSSLIRSVGASPVALTVSERIPALQRGVINGVIGDSSGAYGQGVYDVVKHASIWPVGVVPPWHVVMNRDSFAALPADIQSAMTQEFARFERDLLDEWNRVNDELPARFEAKGVTWHEVPESELNRFRSKEIMQPLFDVWYKNMEARGAWKGDPRLLEQSVREAIAK